MGLGAWLRNLVAPPAPPSAPIDFRRAMRQLVAETAELQSVNERLTGLADRLEREANE